MQWNSVCLWIVYMCVCLCMWETGRFSVDEKERENHDSLITFLFFIGHLLSSWQTIVFRSLTVYAHNKPLYSSILLFSCRPFFIFFSLFFFFCLVYALFCCKIFSMSHVCWLLLLSEIDVAWCDAFQLLLVKHNLTRFIQNDNGTKCRRIVLHLVLFFPV